MPPSHTGVSRQRTAPPRSLPAAGKLSAFHAVNWRTPANKTTTPAAIGMARASAGCRISIAASATPSGKAVIPNTVQTKK